MGVANAELASRTLQITVAEWQSVLSRYRQCVPLAPPGEDVDAEIERCLPALAAAYGECAPHAMPLSENLAGGVCPACGGEVRPLLARRPGIVYGRCTACGHGSVLASGAPPTETDARVRHTDAAYYDRRDAAGVGYDAYDREAAYREAKGARLVERLTERGQKLSTLLEVGSGFGYTRAAAERVGVRTAGVDVNARAGGEARARYGLGTFNGTLGEALRSPASGVTKGAWDAVLYQFVLEHVVDPVRELGEAREALGPGGRLVLFVPSMDAAEVSVFGASYRSFRADHLHLFSRASLERVLGAAGFRPTTCDSQCNLHLFGTLLSPTALDRLYASGRGPDWFVVAEKA